MEYNTMKNLELKKVVLAYSGGLDTSVMIAWLKENFGCEVIAVSGNVGQESELDGLEEKALSSGASKLYIEDIQKEFVEDFVFNTLKAGAKYENQYLLGTAFARPIIGRRMIEIAHKEGADAIVHGCTGKGNDQVRFETTIRHFDPDIKIVAPWRFWEIKSREEEEAYAAERNIPINKNNGSAYSEDRNLWHISHEGLEIEDPANAPNYDNFLTLSKKFEDAKDEAEEIEIEFVEGVPVSINGEKLDGVSLIKKLNKIGGEHAIGIDDIIENRITGIKVRGIYENPAGSILYRAHEILESLTLDGDTLKFKQMLALKYAAEVYKGLWYSKLRESLQAFVDETQKRVSGVVKLKLYKGNIIPNGVESKYSLFSEEFATFGEDGVYDQYDSQGFVNLFALPLKIEAIQSRKNEW
ncbi:argininosuccinate synthase [Peptoniphilus asaccharolyticus DSM 20463]|uniref:Argininosuccinate synthase n=1 Tax=Peptoniphilus asaccharolyticus DSM 20463 TaxID=573058 RepID=A0A1W1UPP7_PEPAS|nr:argininosuccinate synthase [Peptoniphilus asaccharolyticus]SMB82684.1 argininosuccinate synthase [Peptoniphilus asaccharolyticus DSM 20463]